MSPLSTSHFEEWIIKNTQKLMQHFLTGMGLFSPLAVIAASSNVSATANLIPAIVITKNSDLAFGHLSPAAVAGAVTIDPSSNRTQTGGIFLFTSNAGNSASFSLAGNNSAVYVVTLPSIVTLTGPGGATMTANAFSSNPSGTGTFSSSGSASLAIGATLNVSAAQTTGAYVGSFVLDIEQQ